MRVMFTVSGWATHWSAMVPLGWALQAAGHEVRVLCPQSQVRAVARTGMIPVPVLDGLDDTMRLRLQYYEEALEGIWPYPWLPLHPITGAELKSLDEFDIAHYREYAEPVFAARRASSFDAAVAFARSWRPHLALHDPASLEGLLAARVTDVRAALCLWGPVGTHEPEHMRIVPTDHSRSFPRYGLGEFTTDMIEYVIDPCPPSLAPPTRAHRLPVRYVPYNGCEPVPSWLLESPRGRRVCVAWSTALTPMSGPNSCLLPELVAALRDAPYEVVVTATSRDVAGMGDVPSTVRVVERLPLRLVLPSCDAVVHHGGSGSTLTSLWAGLPQFLPTFASEQTATARRVAGTGAALHVLGHLADRTTVRTAVDELLTDDSYRTAGRHLREEILNRPTPAEIVPRLERLALS